MLIKDILEKTTAFLKNKGSPSARLDTELLISSALDLTRVKLYLNYDRPLKEEELSVCRELVRRRAGGEPVAYILGRKDFYKNTFKVTPAVLIPRPETEQIVEDAVVWLRAHPDAARIIDLGTGSGCLGLSIAAEVEPVSALLVDISEDAVAVTRENADALGLADRAEFEITSVEDLECAPADVVVANPPYIAENDSQVEDNVRRFEPKQALFADDEGLAAIRSWARKAVEIAKPGAFVMFEIGHEQGRAAREIFESLGAFEDIKIVKDLSGRERFVRALRAEEN